MKSELDCEKVRKEIEKNVIYIEEENKYFISYGVDEPPVKFLIRLSDSSKEELVTKVSLTICDMYKQYYNSAETLWRIMNG